MDQKNNKHTRSILMALIIILAVIAVTLFINSINLLNNSMNNKNTSESTTKLLDRVDESLKNLREYAVYLEVQAGESNIVSYVYNTKGEALSQQLYELVTSDDGETQETQDAMQTVIYKTDGESVVYDQYIATTDTVDVITLLESVLKAARSGVGVVTENDKPTMENSENFTEINIDIRSYPNITSMYNNIGKEYAYNEVEAIRSLAASYKEKYPEIDVENINLRFIYLIDKTTNELAGASCWMYFGTTPAEKVTYDSDIQLFTNWIMVGHHVIDDWELSEGWYSTDWSDIENWEDFTPAEELLTQQYEEITQILQKHFQSDADGGHVD